MSTKTILITSVVALAAVAGISAVAFNQPKSTMADKIMSKTSEVMMKKDETMTKASSVDAMAKKSWTPAEMEKMKSDEAMTMSKMTPEEKMAFEKLTPDQKMEKEKMMTKDSTSGDAMKKDDAMMKKEQGVMSKTGYTAYSAEALAANSAGTNIIFFHAPWCPSCKSIDSEINANLSKLPVNFQILKADFDTSTDLKKKYGITQQSTFVKIDKDGNKLGTASAQFGLKTLDDIIAFGK